MEIFKKIIFMFFGVSFILFFSSEVILSQLAFSIFEIDLQGNFNLSVTEDEAFVTIKNYAMLSFYKFSFLISSLFFGLISFFIFKNNIKNSSYNFIILIFIIISISTIIPIYSTEVRLSMAIFLDGVNSYNDGSINAFFIERFKSVSYSILSGFSFLASITAIATYLIKK